jgi:hypothetical protein
VPGSAFDSMRLAAFVAIDLIADLEQPRGLASEGEA